jgi:hypothetical protein
MERGRAVTAQVSDGAGSLLLRLGQAAGEPAPGTGSAHEWGTRSRSNGSSYKGSRVDPKTTMLLR